MKNTTSRFVLTIGMLLLGIAQMVAQDQSQLHAAPAMNTDRIAKEVRHELLMLPYYNVFDNIQYKVEGYNVTLIGYVTNPAVKSDAGNAVKRVEGVETVNNQIEVLPPAPMDNQIRPARVSRRLWLPAVAEVRHAGDQADSDHRQRRARDAGGSGG